MPRRTRLRTDKRLADLEAHAKATTPWVQEPQKPKTIDEIVAIITALESADALPPEIEELLYPAEAEGSIGGSPGETLRECRGR